MPVLPRVGERFGRYRIDTQIGRGGMGVVFGATDLSFNRTVALKVVSASLGDSAEFQQRFSREASVLARLDSPHIIAIFDYGVEDDCPYIATQYVGGGDLGGLLRSRGAMPPRLALTVCAQVADALHDAHRVGVVHRDVKPGNVLLRDADAPDPHAYLCDFGIARTSSDGLTTPGQVAGTWSYLSPECGRGAPGTPASDIYALGCLLWVSLTGSPPYTGSDIEVAVAHQEAPVPQVRAVDEGSRRLNEVLARSMAKDPADRYPDADRFRTAMLAAAGVTPSALTPVPQLPAPGLGRALSGSRSGTGSRPGTGPRGTGSGLSLGTLPPYAPPPPKRRSRAGLVAALACVSVLVVAGGVFGVVRLAGGHGSDPATDPTSTGSTSEAPTDSTGPTDQTSTDGPTTEPTADGPVTGDLDGDGLGDFSVLYSHYLSDKGSRSVDDTATWSSTGTSLVLDGVHRAPSYSGSSGSYVFEHLLGDFDGDGTDDDLTMTAVKKPKQHFEVTGTLSGGSSVDVTWAEPKGGSPDPTVADVDGDGDADVVFRLYKGYQARPSVFLVSVNDGDGRLGPMREAATFKTSIESATYVLGDYDGDGDLDLAQVADVGHTKDYDEKYQVSIKAGAGRTFGGGPSRVVRGPCCGPVLLAADLDGDGDDEVVLVEKDSGTSIDALDLVDDRLRVRRVGAVPGAYSTTGPGLTARVSDVNGDGLDDIVLLSVDSATRATLRAAVSNGKQLIVSRWASWKYHFATSKNFEYFPDGPGTL